MRINTLLGGVVLAIFLVSSPTYANLTTALESGLRAYYSFDTDATDQHGSFDGTVFGATHTSSGFLGGAYDFTGNNRIDVGTPLPTGNSARSISMWVNLDGTDTAVAHSLYTAGNGAVSGRHFAVAEFFIGTDGENEMYIRRNVDDLPSQRYTTPTGWHHVLLSYDGSSSHNLDFYINGVNIANRTHPTFHRDRTFSTSNETQAIGGAFWPTEGAIDEVAIWDRALTATEATEVYTTQLALNSTPAAVPEPTSFILLALGSVGFLRRRRS